MNRKALAAALLPLFAAVTAFSAAEHRNRAERAEVEKAVYDYVDALYQVDSTRIARSVHPQLSKVGYMRRQGQPGYFEGRMTYRELESLASSWNRSGRVNPRSARREVQVLDMLDQTASAKLVADWGVDYMHLARYEGRWKIVNVMWQVPPQADAR